MALINQRRRVRGTTTVEAAIVIPLLLLLTFGLIEYANLLLRLEQVENVARQSARLAATPDATTAQVNALITSMMTANGLQSSGYVATFSNPASFTKGQQLSVYIHLPYHNIAITNAPLIPVPTTLGRTVVMAKEGP